LVGVDARRLEKALKLLGERNYFDFHVERTGKAQRIGDISIILRKTDPKRNKYTVEVLAGDKRTEKKEKGINEPVQFYVSKARQPYEIVVNEVGKDLIVGYLTTPKDQVARN
jgi:3'-phosphoadenosine 5'-phosphosulfate sulfotransferase